MDDAAAVGVAEAPHDLGDEVQRLPPVELAPLFHILLEGDTVDELHDDILNVAAPGHVIDRDDVGMGQLRNRLGLGVEPSAEILVLRKVAFEDLDGHQAVEAVTLCLIYHGHTARTDPLQDLVAVVQHFTNVLIHIPAPPSYAIRISTAVTLSEAPLALEMASRRSMQVARSPPWSTSNSIS